MANYDLFTPTSTSSDGSYTSEKTIATDTAEDFDSFLLLVASVADDDKNSRKQDTTLDKCSFDRLYNKHYKGYCHKTDNIPINAMESSPLKKTRRTGNSKKEIQAQIDALRKIVLGADMLSPSEMKKISKRKLLKLNKIETLEKATALLEATCRERNGLKEQRSRLEHELGELEQQLTHVAQTEYLSNYNEAIKAKKKAFSPRVNYESCLFQSSNPVLIWNSEGRIVFGNQIFMNEFCVSKDEVFGAYYFARFVQYPMLHDVIPPVHRKILNGIKSITSGEQLNIIHCTRQEQLYRWDAHGKVIRDKITGEFTHMIVEGSNIRAVSFVDKSLQKPLKFCSGDKTSFKVEHATVGNLVDIVIEDNRIVEL